MPSFYDRHVLPWLLSHACATPPVMKLRSRVVPHAEGRVLELGIGGGLNLPLYDPARVQSVVGVDPLAELRARADAAPRPEGITVSIREGVAESLPFDDGSFDTVVCTFTLCSVASPSAALREARRVLKPGGSFAFCEHGLSPDARVVRWQHRMEPVWKLLAGGCHLTRPVAAAIAGAGFRIERQDSMYLPRVPKFAGWAEWGLARRA